jgi:hypothetical protein
MNVADGLKLQFVFFMETIHEPLHLLRQTKFDTVKDY